MNKTTICNLALAHLAQSVRIGNVDTDQTLEAIQFRSFFEPARDEVFRDFVWPFATVFGSLALVASQPTEEWAYSYRMPPDAKRFVRIRNGATRSRARNARVPYRFGRDGLGQLIYCDLADATAEWIVSVIDTEQWAPDFTQAVALLLASYIAPTLTGGDQFGLGQKALQRYMAQVEHARMNALNEIQDDDDPDGDLVIARG